MNPQKRQRRANVRRAVGTEAQPKKPTRKQPKAVEKTTGEDARTTGVPRRRRTASGPVTPAWKVAGSAPRTPEEETPDVAGD